jgi:hypothetical protein
MIVQHAGATVHARLSAFILLLPWAELFARAPESVAQRRRLQ